MNIRSETMEFLEENRGSKFFDIDLSSIFVSLTPKTRETKAK